MDDIETMARSSWTIQTSTWLYLNSGTYWIIPANRTFDLWRPHFSTSVVNFYKWDYTNKIASSVVMGIDEYSNLLINETRNMTIMEIANLNMEIYMVWPDTYTVPSTWKGWCLQKINGKDVPVACP